MALVTTAMCVQSLARELLYALGMAKNIYRFFFIAKEDLAPVFFCHLSHVHSYALRLCGPAILQEVHSPGASTGCTSSPALLSPETSQLFFLVLLQCCVFREVLSTDVFLFISPTKLCTHSTLELTTQLAVKKKKKYGVPTVAQRK